MSGQAPSQIDQAVTFAANLQAERSQRPVWRKRRKLAVYQQEPLTGRALG